MNSQLQDEDRRAILRLPMTIKALAPRQDIVREGDRLSQCGMILEGIACRYKFAEDGKRQILSFHIAGDVPDLQSLFLSVMDHGVSTIDAAKVAFIPHEAIIDSCQRHPGLAQALWRDSLIDAAIYREWITNIGRRDALPRIAHLLCETFARSRAAGLAPGDTFDMPVTQAELADATGLSTVHVNRTIQELRAANLITMHGGAVTVLDREALERAGQFDPAYLHLRQA